MIACHKKMWLAQLLLFFKNKIFCDNWEVIIAIVDYIEGHPTLTLEPWRLTMQL